MVSTIQTAINMDIECGTYDQLAEALNLQGYTNSKGQSFSGSILQKYLHRIRHPKGFNRVLNEEMMEFRDRYFPEEGTQITTAWDYLPMSEDNKPTKSDIALEKFSYAVIASNPNHFYGECSYA